MLASRSATNTNLQPYLFGSILTATANDVWTVLALGAVIIVVFAMALYRILNRWVEVSK